MATPKTPFRESSLYGAPIRDLKLTIEGTPLAAVIDEFRQELHAKGIRVSPVFHLSTEWGVPFGTIVIGVPFYLARTELTELHGEEVGLIEGLDRQDILKYLRHEMGHVINYAYKLYDDGEWVKLFGSITQPYLEDYRPQPFSRRFVRHLPGWYAQKHPDEDWSETFAVWMTPLRDWRSEYQSGSAARAKLEFCDRTMARLQAIEPLVTATELDQDVSELGYSLADYYKQVAADKEPSPGLDGDLRAIFAQRPPATGPSASEQLQAASALIRRLERALMADVFRWTGHFPEKTRVLVRHMAARAEALQLSYVPAIEQQVTLEIVVLVTALAMNHVHRGSYFPEAPPAMG
jgi:hypothetical protein